MRDLAPETRRHLRTIILAQCAGLPVGLLFSNGFFLAFFARLAWDSADILKLLREWLDHQELDTL